MSVNFFGLRRSAPRRTAAAAVLLLLVGVLHASTAQGAAAAPTAWSGDGPGVISTVSDGLAGAPQFTYNLDPAGLGTVSSWSFSTVADTTGTINVPYRFTGVHAFFQVTVSLTAFVDNGDVTTTPLVNEGPVDCCTSPSAGFNYSGNASFDVAAGNRYGFTITGSNGDYNNFLRGSLTLNSTPYVNGVIIEQNTSWTNAANLPEAAAVAGTLGQPGEARWYKFPVVPSSSVQVDLTDLAQNYDLTLYRDIGQAFTTLTSPADLPRLGAEFAADVYSPSVYSPSVYSPSVYSPSVYSPSVYSPSVYSPSVYSPSVYSPSVYSPSVYSPSVYSPSVYSPSVYSPSVYSPSDAFVEAFSSAQTRSLIGFSAQEGVTPESIRAGTWNNTGSFYVRVQGRNGASSPTPYSITLTTTGGPCTGVTLETKSGLASIAGTPGAARSIVITDTSRMVLTAAAAADFNGRLGQLAGRTGGVVLDLKDSPRVVALNAQADSVKACSYAKNLVGEAIRDIVKSYRDATGTVQSIVLAGDDSVIPFFRYPDTAGLGAEQDYVPPVADSSASQASLRNNQVLGQDAYGSLLDLPVKGGVLPIPDLPVGRLVETPGEIAAQITDFLGLTNGTLPVPTSSLSTGYDFLTSAADAVQTEFVAGLAAGSTTDTLITDQGIPTTTTTANGVPSRDRSWTAADLRAKLATRHDLTFLAGHFSANSALAADYATSVVTTEFANRPDLFRRSVVFSPGCHSGYNILDPDGVPGLTENLDWPQLMARQRATLIAGTGYQYADTDFLAYSAKLYTGLARQLRTGPAGTPVAIGDALIAAKQGYLADVVTLTGIDQKTIIEATLFGLPMTGLDMPNRTTAPGVVSSVTPVDVAAGTPGAQLGLQTATLSPAIATTVNTRPVLDLAGSPTGANFRWLSGQNGVHNAPALPALPKQVIDATSSTGGVLRGIGFRAGSYADTAGVTPLTGAPVTEQNGIHTSFSSPAFFPQKLATANYFGALGGTGDGRTRVVLTPAQYRSDAGALTTTERAYSTLGLSLFYSSSFEQAGGNTPALAAPPSISEVVGTESAGGITVSARVTGDPSAGIQQAWVTYTAEAGPLHGAWASLDLVQDPIESTLWSGTIALPSGQSAADVRFILQAVNGVGLVGLDNNIGVGYTAGPQVGTTPPATIATTLTLGATAASGAFGSTLPVSATLVGAPAGAIVTFAVDGATVSATTDASGVASAGLPLQTRVGTYPLTASYAGDAQHAASFASTPGFTIVRAATSLTVTVRSGPVPVTGDPAGYVTLRSGTTPLAQKPVLLRVFDATGKQVAAEVRTTNPLGRVGLHATKLPPGTLAFVATFGIAAPGVSADPSYAGSTALGVFIVPGLPVLRLPAPLRVTTRSTSVVVKYTATAVDGVGVSLVVTCAPKSGSTFLLGTTVVTCSASNSARERTTGTFTVTVVKRS